MDGLAQPATGRPRPVVVAFWGLVVLGALLRLGICSCTEGIIHPDEHQQYLEPAQGIVYGYYVQCWEYARGARHYLYPGALAGVLYVLDRAGVRDPLWQAALIRMLLGLAALASVAWFAQRRLLQGRTAAALCLMFLYALAPDVINMDKRTLSETASATALLIGIGLLERRRAAAAGVVFGLMFAIRFQSALFVPGLLGFAVYDDWTARRSWRSSEACRMTAGLAVALVVVGFIDRCTWGAWFHSSIEYFRANIVEGVAASFGVEPWHYYAGRYGQMLIGAFPLLMLLPIAVIGAVREPRLALAALTFTLPHLMIGHKELRFLWPAVPLALAIAAAGLEWLYERRAVEHWRLGLSAAMAILLLAGFVMRATHVPWNREPSGACAAALTQVGRRADLTGVAVYGAATYECGNYFYLRRNVPLQPSRHVAAIKSCLGWTDGSLNYLIAPASEIHKFDECELQQVGTAGDFGIYHVVRSQHAQRRQASFSTPAGAVGSLNR